jgi:hypothetical protein
MISVIEFVASALEAVTGVVAATFILGVAAGVIAYILVAFFRGYY